MNLKWVLRWNYTWGDYPRYITNTRRHTNYLIRLKVRTIHILFFGPRIQYQLHHSENQFESKLHYVRIYFDTPKFEKITKDRAAKPVDMLSAIGGTMGLLTGFSILSGVEIIYFAFKIVLSLVTKRKRK